MSSEHVLRTARSQADRVCRSRFTDFLVNEVGLDGNVVRLKDIDGPRARKDNRQAEGAANQEQENGDVARKEKETAAAEEESKATEAAPELVSVPCL